MSVIVTCKNLLGGTDQKDPHIRFLESSLVDSAVFGMGVALRQLPETALPPSFGRLNDDVPVLQHVPHTGGHQTLKRPVDYNRTKIYIFENHNAKDGKNILLSANLTDESHSHCNDDCSIFPAHLNKIYVQ